MDIDWHDTENVLSGHKNKLKDIESTVRVAAFDLDDTLIHRPKSRKGKEDPWKLTNSDLNSYIRDLVNDGYLIVIFSNQSGMSTGKNFNHDEWMEGVSELAELMFKGIKRFYFAVYAAKKYDMYRKPNRGMWNLMKSDLEETFNVEKIKISKKSFFCGDAAGRKYQSIFRKKIYPKGKAGDFSDTDRKFAMNIGIDFLTPEEFFLENHADNEYTLSGITSAKMDEILKQEPEEYEFTPRKKEIIVTVGLPASGKSSFVKKYIVPKGYDYISRDELKSEKKVMEALENSLSEGNKIVLDNTSPDTQTRMKITTLAKKHGYKHIRALVFDYDMHFLKHMNNVRHIYSDGDIPKINNITYAVFKNKFTRPEKYEHFDKIEYIPFMLDPEMVNDKKWMKSFRTLSES